MLIFGCREVEGLLHTEKDPKPHLHHKPNPQLNPHQHISLTLWPHPHPTRQQGHSHKLQLHNHNLQLHSHKLHGHRNQVSGTLQTSGIQLEELTCEFLYFVAYKITCYQRSCFERKG